MSPDPATNVLTRLHRAFNERDAETARGLLADDVVWHVSGDHPVAGTYRGRDQVWEHYVARFWPTPAHLVDHAALSHPDHRLVAVLHEVVHDFGDGEIRLGGIEVARTADGQITERWEYGEDQALVDRIITEAAERRRQSTRR